MEKNETWQSDKQRPRHKAAVNVPASNGLVRRMAYWNRDINETCL